MQKIHYREWGIDGPRYWGLLAVLAAIVAVAGFAVLHMEHEGHWVTGMSNQIVWGTPHVFAIFLIVAASGALNVASIASVFGRSPPPHPSTAAPPQLSSIRPPAEGECGASYPRESAQAEKS